jgi:hypothetical protein
MVWWPTRPTAPVVTPFSFSTSAAMSAMFFGSFVECGWGVMRRSRSQIVCTFECMGSPWKIELVSSVGSPRAGTTTMASPHHVLKFVR